MIPEINAAVEWLSQQMLSRRDDTLSEGQVERFKYFLRSILLKKFKTHWYERTPWRGQAFRSIMHDPCRPLDPVLVDAANQAKITNLKHTLPTDGFHLWIDPGEVEIRFDESRVSHILYRSEGDSSGSVPLITPSPSLAKTNDKEAPSGRGSLQMKPTPHTFYHSQQPRSFVARQLPASRLGGQAALQRQPLSRPVNDAIVMKASSMLNYHAPPFMVKAK